MNRSTGVLVLAAVITVLAATACTGPGEETHDVPVASLADATAATRTRLAGVVAALMAVAPDARHDPSGARIGPTPCGENGPEYQVVATDQINLPGVRHRAVAAAAVNELARRGFTVTATRDLTGQGAELTLSGPDGYDAVVSSNANDTWLAITLSSPCMITPDGRYPAD